MSARQAKKTALQIPADQPVQRVTELEPRNEPEADANQPDTNKTETKNDAAKAPGDTAKPRRRRPFIWIILILGVILGGGAAFHYWQANRYIESTDDAFVDGRAITIAPQVSGLVISLDVTDNQFVHRGDPLIHIDPRQYLYDKLQAESTLATAKAQFEGTKLGVAIAKKNFPAALEQAQAQLATAKANLVKAQADYDRQKSLPKLATSQQEVDQATSALHQAQAQVMLADAQVTEAEPVQERIDQTATQVGQLGGQIGQAQSRLDQANLNISWTIVTAPQDGWITKRNVEVGNYVTPGQQIFSIVSPDVWITANFKESQLNLMRPGQPVDISVDAYPSLKLKGHVDSVQLGSGSKFTAFPPENATGNFVKIVQRVPVKIVIDSGLDPQTPLGLGLSVEPRVTVK
jgi:membrane fusion protein (multidrug efflux system)